MKALFLLLVLLNLGALAWQFIDATPAAVEGDEPKTLVLLRELSPEQLKQLAPVTEPSLLPEELP